MNANSLFGKTNALNVGVFGHCDSLPKASNPAKLKA